MAPKYNEIFLYLGDWGRWQKTVFFFVSAPIIFAAVHTYLNSFTAAVAEHRRGRVRVRAPDFARVCVCTSV